jgi:hypothetical protein
LTRQSILFLRKMDRRVSPVRLRNIFSSQSLFFRLGLEGNVMVKLSAIAFMVTIMAPLPAIAYTQEDANACTPDAMRLCQNAIPDVSRVTLCLVQNKRQLSPACTIVFNRLSGASADGGRPQTIQRTNY